MKIMGKKPSDNTKKDDTTLIGFIRWLYRRHKLRRRYETDAREGEAGRHAYTAALYLVLLTFVLSASIVFVRLYTVQNTVTLENSVNESALSANPALQKGSVTCTVQVQIGASTSFFWETPAMTVSAMLTDVGYTPSADDVISVSPETVVEEGMTVKVTLVTFEEDEKIVSTPYQTEYKDIRTIPRGTTRRISYGTEGVAKQTVRTRYENGVAVSSEVLKETVVTKPVNEVLERGVGGVVTGVDGSFRYSYYIDVTATAYGGPNVSKYTYSGTLAQEGVIAVDPSVIPLRTKVYVKGSYGDYGVCSADDIGGGIKGNHIDIFMDATLEEMYQFGRRKMRVYILE